MMNYGPYNSFEIATILGVSRDTVLKWTRKYRDFPTSRTGLRDKHVIYADELHGWFVNQNDSRWMRYALKLESFFKKPQISSIEGDLLAVEEKEEY